MHIFVDQFHAFFKLLCENGLGSSGSLQLIVEKVNQMWPIIYIFFEEIQRYFGAWEHLVAFFLQFFINLFSNLIKGINS